MAKTNHQHPVPVSSIQIPHPAKPELDHYIVNDVSFPSMYLKTLAAIATEDGLVNLAEYSVLMALASKAANPALAVEILIYALDNPLQIKEALSRLKIASGTVSDDIRNASWSAAFPLLSLQGDRSRGLAQRLASSLSIDKPDILLASLSGDSCSLWKGVSRTAVRLLRRQEILPFAEECVRLTGNDKVAAAIVDFLDGRIEASQLQTKVMAATAEIAIELVEYEQALAKTEATMLATSDDHLQTAGRLHDQIIQRLKVAEARIQFDLNTFDDDIEEIVCDAGNAFEVDVEDRLKTDDWKNPKTWRSIGRTTFGKELERRIDRAIRRREQSLHLMKEELRLFQEDLRFAQAQILGRLHHSQLSALMPDMTFGTRLIFAANDAANLTINFGTVAAVGTGAAAYFMGAAILPFITPVAPYALGAIAVASLVKWITNPNGRKDVEVQTKRATFENVLRQQLAVTRESYVEQLSQLAKEYQATAGSFLTPMMIEAQATARFQKSKLKINRRVMGDVQILLDKLNTSVGLLTA